MFTFPGIRVGNPICHESLTVFPLFTEPHGQVEYLLSDEAIQAGAVTVQEVSEGGSVPDLLVENTGDIRVLFLEGEEPKILRACRILMDEKIAQPVLLGNQARIHAAMAELHLHLDGLRIVDPAKSDRLRPVLLPSTKSPTPATRGHYRRIRGRYTARGDQGRPQGNRRGGSDTGRRITVHYRYNTA